MKKITNHQPGPRGINLVGGGTRWVEPGETVEIDAKTIDGDLPDFGKAGEASADATAEIDRLKAALAAETERADVAEKSFADATAEIEKLTAPKK